eukprot:CAMPEP_0176167442 /NCGR_PEP_ID=MMETSP0120_2-20121206/85669_1 /TAXON_ID=160619 /ORGANISM="Kryptoperidinium foliaceum, Strain CCMP 1326" /LENGTH=173 /DNA_ID=CAMNT_0017505071 /DNA_START=63 /DNA_END=581 /DNA_ORIENTATION=+
MTGSFVCGMTAIQQQNDRDGQTKPVPSPPSDLHGLTISSSVAQKQLPYSQPRPLTPEELKLPTPVIVMGLMKAGTTSIYGYFKCGLRPEFHSRLSHYDCNASGGTMSCGKRMRRNIQKMKKPAFDQMDQFILYAELDAQELNGGMTLPQWDFLQQIYDAFPNATWVLNVREAR